MNKDELAEAILKEWEEGGGSTQLPSAFQLGDSVNLNFHRCGLLAGGKIIKVHFGYGKVLYDVELPVLSEPCPLEKEKEVNYTRVYNIDSMFVEKPK